MTWGYSPPWQVSRGSRVNHSSAGRSLCCSLISARIRKQRWDKKQGCALNLKAQPLGIHFLQLNLPSLQFHTLSMKCHYQGTKYTNSWDRERYFMFRPKHKSVFLFHNSFPCLCCYRKVHLSLNILSFRPLYLKKYFNICLYVSQRWLL